MGSSCSCDLAGLMTSVLQAFFYCCGNLRRWVFRRANGFMVVPFERGEVQSDLAVPSSSSVTPTTLVSCRHTRVEWVSWSLVTPIGLRENREKFLSFQRRQFSCQGATHWEDVAIVTGTRRGSGTGNFSYRAAANLS